MWVADIDTDTVRRVFLRARAVRGLGDEARLLSDTYFIETVVRLHRASEGVPFTGLKPAGRDLGPAIPAADRALRTGNPGPLHAVIEGPYRRRLDSLLRAARALQHHSAKDVQGGRRFVEAYVEYIHYVERLHEAASTSAEGHFREPGVGTLYEDQSHVPGLEKGASWEGRH